MNTFILKLVNILLPPLTLAILLPLQLPFFLFRLFSYVARSLSTEDVSGKVVLITGAASGIGKELAYEYARRGSCLALVDIRPEGLEAVAQHSLHLGSPDVITIGADVSNLQDCKRFVDQTIDHYGKLDHLVNNAGILKVGLLGSGDVSEYTSILDVNFWGCVYGTHFAVPHLKKSKGKVIVMSSFSGICPAPYLGFYSASKAALISFYQALKFEMGSEIGVTIVTPSFVTTEMIKGEATQSIIGSIPVGAVEECANKIVGAACRGDRYLTEPLFMRAVYMLTILCPSELLEWAIHFFFVARIQSNTNKLGVSSQLKDD